MNAIIEAVAVDEKRASSANVDGLVDVGRAYFEQAVVSLASARRENPGCDALMVANRPPPADLAILAGANGVGVLEVPFDDFSPSKRIPWELAFYKLRALAAVHALGKYDHLCLLDTDTWCQASLGELLDYSGGASWWTSTAASPMRTA